MAEDAAAPLTTNKTINKAIKIQSNLRGKRRQCFNRGLTGPNPGVKKFFEQRIPEVSYR